MLELVMPIAAFVVGLVRKVERGILLKAKQIKIVIILILTMAVGSALWSPVSAQDTSTPTAPDQPSATLTSTPTITSTPLSCTAILPLITQHLSSSCANLANDQACYANGTVKVEYVDASNDAPRFTAPGDTAPLASLKS